MSNRFAWAWKLASSSVPVVLIYLGFLRADEMRDKGKPFRGRRRVGAPRGRSQRSPRSAAGLGPEMGDGAHHDRAADPIAGAFARGERLAGSRGAGVEDCLTGRWR